MKEKPTNRLDVRIAPSLKRTLFRKAEKAGVKASDIIRAGIKDVLSKDVGELRKLTQGAAYRQRQ